MYTHTIYLKYINICINEFLRKMKVANIGFRRVSSCYFWNISPRFHIVKKTTTIVVIAYSKFQTVKILMKFRKIKQLQVMFMIFILQFDNIKFDNVLFFLKNNN